MGEKFELKLRLADLNVDKLVEKYGQDYKNRVLEKAQEIAFRNRWPEITTDHVKVAVLELEDRAGPNLDAVLVIETLKSNIYDTILHDAEALAKLDGSSSTTVEHVRKAIANRNLQTFAK